MKQYVIDQLRLEDYQAVKTYLDETLGAPEMPGLYWMPIDPGVLTDCQKSHVECSPHVFALELTENRISCELLVRTKNRMRCDCVAYATRDQRNWLTDVIDAVFEKLHIKI